MRGLKRERVKKKKNKRKEKKVKKVKWTCETRGCKCRWEKYTIKL